MFNLMPWKKEKDNNVKEFKKEFNNLFDQFFGDDFFPVSEQIFEKSWNPRVDVSEGKKEITVRAEIPGVDSDDIEVLLDNRILTIKGEKKQEKEEKGENSYHVERSYGYFNRSIELPAEVDQEKIEAKYKKGILKIVLKKTKESKSRKIQIKAD